jgi:high affinity Mn2+ porin
MPSGQWGQRILTGPASKVQGPASTVQLAFMAVWYKARAMIARGASRFAGTLVLSAVLGNPTGVSAQTTPEPAAPLTLAPHSPDASWWLSGQLNVIWQGHGAFPSPYQGPNSLLPVSEHATSSVWTIDGGVRVSKRLDFWCDIESAGGGGISQALGLAGFTNLDVVRNPSLGMTPYLARASVHVTLPLGAGTTMTDRRPWSFGTDVPAHRVEIRAGKMSLADFFDLNSVGSDSHLQFTNWTIDNNGAYDYAADTRGYTYAAMVEYDAPQWSVRAAEALMPTVANGIDLEWNIARARADNVELELRPAAGLVVRVLGYRNHANMGRYEDAIRAFESGVDPAPDITAHREQGRVKWGAGLNAEYAISHARLFGRTGGNEGENESFAYTEVNNTIATGGDLDGALWRREHDRVGVALVSNGLSAAHQEYLRLGGLGFLLGDGTLTYGRETIVEAYYTTHVWRGVFASAQAHHIENPGDNRDRGPVTVAGLRLHLDF